MPLCQDVEGGHCPAQAHLEVTPHAMHDTLEMITERQHRQDSFDHHPHIPRPAWTDLEIGWGACVGMKASVSTDNHLLFKLLDERLEDRIRDVRRVARPADDQTQLIQQQAEFTANNPAMIRDSVASDLMRRAPFADGVDEFDAVSVNDAEHSRLGHKALRPSSVRAKEAKQAGSFRQGRKQRLEVTLKPTVERSVANAFDGEQEGERRHFAWMKFGLHMSWRVGHRIIYAAEQFSDKVLGGHDGSLQRFGFGQPQHLKTKS